MPGLRVLSIPSRDGTSATSQSVEHSSSINSANSLRTIKSSIPTTMLQELLPLIIAALHVDSVVSTAATTFLTEIFAFIPNLIGAAIVLVVGYLLVTVIVKALRIGMQRANVDGPVGRTELGQYIERSGQSFSSLVSNVVKWVLYFIVAVYAIGVLNIAALTLTMMGILAWLPNLVGAGIIVVVGSLIASFAGKAIGDTLRRYGVGAGRIIGLAVKLLIYAIVFDFALIQLGLGQGILYTTTSALAWGLAAAFAIGLGVPIAYSLKGPMTSMASGATTIASTLKEGQHITVDGIENVGDHGKVTGTVRRVGMFNTVIESGGNGAGTGYMILPNSLLIEKPIMVDGGEVPKLWDDGVRDRVTDLDNRADPHPESYAESGRPVRSESDDYREVHVRPE
jgi:hypothetical protein